MRKMTTKLMTGLLVIGMIGIPATGTAKNASAANATLKAKDNERIISGKTAYYVKWKQKKNGTNTIVYRSDLKGKKVKKINTFAGYYTIEGMYNKGIYFCNGNEMDGFNTFVCKGNGSAKLKKVQSKLNIYGMSGKYVVGTSSEPTDVGAKTLCLYNLSTKKRQNLGEGYAPCIINNKVYYASYNKTRKAYNLMKCSLNGKNKKVVAKFPKADLLVVNKILKNQAKYYTIDNANKIKNNILKF